jgi:hypothetical protein
LEPARISLSEVSLQRRVQRVIRGEVGEGREDVRGAAELDLRVVRGHARGVQLEVPRGVRAHAVEVTAAEIVAHGVGRVRNLDPLHGGVRVELALDDVVLLVQRGAVPHEPAPLDARAVSEIVAVQREEHVREEPRPARLGRAALVEREERRHAALGHLERVDVPRRRDHLVLSLARVDVHVVVDAA